MTEASPIPSGVDGRTWHFGDFYGVSALPEDTDLLLVHGNCQAESLRVVLAAALAEEAEVSGAPLHPVRVPAVHELVADDVPHLKRILARCRVLVAQPVSDDYRDLPLGTAQVRAAAPHARVVMIPVVRDSRLHPFQALVRVAAAGDPPVVPYHDLRTLAVAASSLTDRPLGPRAIDPGVDGRVDRDGVAAVAAASQAELRRRQDAAGSLAVDDLLEAAGAAASHTLNHPGNLVLVGLAQRILDALGTGGVARDPGRVLLRSVLAPLQPEVLDVLGLDVAAARQGWLVDGEPVDEGTVRDTQLRWYTEHPDVVRAGLDRHGDTMAVLGL